MKTTFSETDMRRLFDALNQELKDEGIKGELYVVGGAVMCLVHHAREATRDVDGYFKPALSMREAAERVARRMEVSLHWLNDAVKGFLSDRGDFVPFLELSHLKIYTAQSEYLLAMKCLAMRIGEEFYDLDDVRFLLRHLNVESYDEAIAIITRYYPIERIPQKTLYVLEEMLGK